MAIVTASLVYLFLSTFQIDLPGLYYDEALDAVPAMQTLMGRLLDITGSFRLGDREWPLMVMAYVGPTTSYLTMPGFLLVDVGVRVLRVSNIMVGLVTLLLAWGFLREYFDERVAALSVFLLAVNPTFVFWSRIGAIVSLPMLPLAILMLWSLWRWYRRDSGGYLVLAALLLGLGITTKILFVWLSVGLALAWLVFSPFLQPGRGWAAWRWPLEYGTALTRILAVGALLLGLAPLLLYNLRDFGTLQLLSTNLTQTQLYGVNNLDLPANLRTVFLEDFPSLLRGVWWAGPTGELHVNRLALPAFLMTVVILPILMARGQLFYRPLRLALFYVLIAAIVAQSAVTVSSLGAAHLMIVWPMPQALTAAALINLLAVLTSYWSAQRRIWVTLGAVAAVILVVAEVRTTWQYHMALQRTGGAGHYSDAIYKLAHDLDQAHETPTIALDWGFRRSLQLLTQDRVNPEERFTYGPQPDEPVETFINWRVSQGPALYLLNAPRYTAFPGHREIFFDAVYRHRLTPILWESYRQRDGELVFEVFSLQPAERQFSPPAMQHSVRTDLGGVIALLGFDLAHNEVRPGEKIPLTLYWQSQAPVADSFKVFVHLLDDHGRLWGQYDSIPVLGGYPTTEWQVDEVVEDSLRLRVDAEIPPGVYRLFIGMYFEPTGERLPLSLHGLRLVGDTLELATITVDGN